MAKLNTKGKRKSWTARNVERRSGQRLRERLVTMCSKTKEKERKVDDEIGRCRRLPSRIRTGYPGSSWQMHQELGEDERKNFKIACRIFAGPDFAIFRVTCP